MGSFRLLARSGAVSTAVWLLCGSAFGHVGWRAPETGAQLLAGSEVELEWVDEIPHSTEGYLIEFYAGADARRTIVGYFDASEHSLLWQVPEQVCDDCSLVVTQVNDGGDYDATLRFSIVLELMPDSALNDESSQAMPDAAPSSEPPQAMPDSTSNGEPSASGQAPGEATPSEPATSPSMEASGGAAGSEDWPTTSNTMVGSAAPADASQWESADMGMNGDEGVGCSFTHSRRRLPDAASLGIGLMMLAPLVRRRARRRRRHSTGSAR